MMKTIQMISTTSRVNYKRLFATLLTSTVLSACGGGGGSPPVTPPPPVSTELAQEPKTRDLPGFTVTLTPYVQNSAPTIVSRVEVSVSDPAAVTLLDAALGKDFDTGTLVSATSKSSGLWSIAIPSSLAAGSGVQLNFTLKNDDKFESGVSDFMIK